MALMLWFTVHGMASIAVAKPIIPTDFAQFVVEFTGGPESPHARRR